MAIARYRPEGRTDGSPRSPAGGCWLPEVTVTTGSLLAFRAGEAAGQDPFTINRPSEFYPQGYPLPRNQTEYCVLYSVTNEGRIIPYVPGEYTPRAMARRGEVFDRGLRPDERFEGLPVAVIHRVGDSAIKRRQDVINIFDDIENALEGS